MPEGDEKDQIQVTEMAGEREGGVGGWDGTAAQELCAKRSEGDLGLPTRNRFELILYFSQLKSPLIKKRPQTACQRVIYLWTGVDFALAGYLRTYPPYIWGVESNVIGKRTDRIGYFMVRSMRSLVFFGDGNPRALGASRHFIAFLSACASCRRQCTYTRTRSMSVCLPALPAWCAGA